MERILITGANGQIGADLVDDLNGRAGIGELVLVDLTQPEDPPPGAQVEVLDVREKDKLGRLISSNEIDTVFHLASLLSARGEHQPDATWDVNMRGLKNVLELAAEQDCKVFWPSSIAVFGPATPRAHTPQYAALDPYTMYGVTKVSGEYLCRYYHHKHGVDVRSLRYPGIISHKRPPGGGTTDYAVDIFTSAVEEGTYKCFLKPKTRLPMMYMPDAVNAALALMEAERDRINVRTSYNIAAVSFAPEDIVAALQQHMPEFTCAYEPDERQSIADSWPASIDNSAARRDWGWHPSYDLPALVEDMLTAVRAKHSVGV